MTDNSENQPIWYTLPTEAVAKELQVDPAKGLSSAEAQQRLQKYGQNQLAGKKKEPGWQAFLRQYKDFMQILLLGAAAVNLVVTGEWGTTLVLIVLTIFNAVLGLNQRIQGRGQPGCAGKNDEEHRPRAPGRAGDRDRRGEPGAG